MIDAVLINILFVRRSLINIEIAFAFFFFLSLIRSGRGLKIEEITAQGGFWSGWRRESNPIPHRSISLIMDASHEEGRKEKKNVQWLAC